MAKKSSAYWKKKRGSNLSKLGNKVIRAYQKPSVSTIANAAWRGVKYIRSLVNSEVFKFDIALASSAVNNTPAVYMNLTGIGQGNDVSSRTGNSILNKGYYVNLALTKHASATFSIVRIVIVLDRQQIADTSPAWSDIFDANSVYGKVSPNTAGRFSILYDKRIMLSTQRDFKMMNIYKRLQLHTRYNGTGASDIQKNGIYLLAVSTEATNTPTLNYTSRTYFHDN